MNRVLFFALLYFLLPLITIASGAESGKLSSVPGYLQRQRYALANASVKLIDNSGEGYDALYGLRNMRSVLNGVYYRGGANNINNKHKKRSNMNPLPDEGLLHLCQEGFTDAVYLYSTRFGTAPQRVRCRTFEGAENTLTYTQVSPLAFQKADLDKLHSLIFEHLRNARLGPIYAHCWNGWHASGYVAATTLRQFCGFSEEQAVQYWNLNADGNNGASYNGIRNKIREFRPNPDLSLTEEEKSILCPAPGSLNF